MKWLHEKCLEHKGIRGNRCWICLEEAIDEQDKTVEKLESQLQDCAFIHEQDAKDSRELQKQNTILNKSLETVKEALNQIRILGHEEHCNIYKPLLGNLPCNCVVGIVDKSLVSIGKEREE